MYTALDQSRKPFVSGFFEMYSLSVPAQVMEKCSLH